MPLGASIFCPLLAARDRILIALHLALTLLAAPCAAHSNQDCCSFWGAALG